MIQVWMAQHHAEQAGIAVLQPDHVGHARFGVQRKAKIQQ